MRAKVLSENLKSAVKWLKPGTPKGSVLPVLSNVLIEAKHQGVRLTLTDLDLAVSAFAGGKVSVTGATTIPFKEFARLVESLPDDLAEFKTSQTKKGQFAKETCTVSCGSLSVDFRAITADEFPLIKPVQGDTLKDVARLPEACRLIVHAISTGDGRPALNYACWHEGCIVGVDGFRLAKVDLPTPNGKPIYLPVGLVGFLSRQKDGPTKAVVNYESNGVAVWFGDSFVQAKMYNGNWPDWKQIAPSSFAWEIRVPYQPLYQAAKLLKQLAPGADILRLQYKRGKLVLTASESETFEATQEIRAEAEGVKNLAEPFALNVKYLLDTLGARGLDDKEWVAIQGVSPSSPLVISDFRSGLWELMMPMHI